MRSLIGPRALQCLALLILRNNKARKIQNSKSADYIKDFLRDYNRIMLDDRDKIVRVVLIAK